MEVTVERDPAVKALPRARRAFALWMNVAPLSPHGGAVRIESQKRPPLHAWRFATRNVGSTAVLGRNRLHRLCGMLVSYADQG